MTEPPAADAPAALCPALQGFAQMRCWPVHAGQGADSSPFQRSFLALELGSLRWCYPDSEGLSEVTCGYLVSKVFSKDLTHSGKSKVIGRKPAQTHILSLQLMTKDGTYQFEVSLPVSVSAIWLGALDLHFAHCSRQLSKLPAHAFEALESFPMAYDISTKMNLLIHGEEHALRLGLLDDTDDLAQTILDIHGLEQRHKLTVEHSLLKEQRQLAADLLALYRGAESSNHRLQQTCLLLEQRATQAEEHAEKLVVQLDAVEAALPLLRVKLDQQTRTSGQLQPLVLPVTVTASAGQAAAEQKDGMSVSPTASRGRARSRSPGRASSPSYAFPTASSRQDNLRAQYEAAKTALAETAAALTAARADLQRERMANEHSSQQARLQLLAAENQTLRAVSATMRDEIAGMHRQLQDIQSAAQRTVHELVQEQARQQRPAPIAFLGTQRRPSMVARPVAPLAPLGPAAVEDDEYSQLDAREGAAAVLVEERAAPGDVYPLALVRGWTTAYCDVIPVQTDPRYRRLMALVVHALRWPALEDCLLHDLYSRYATASKGGLTITMFIRMMKDFRVLAHDPHERSPSPTRSAIATDDDHARLTYSDLSMVFTQAGRLAVDDLPKKPHAFKVSHHAPVDSSRAGRGRAALQAGTPQVTSCGVTSALTRKQFLAALQAVAERVFSSLVRRASGADPGCLGPSVQATLKRTSLELMMVKVLAPGAITHDVLPWALVYMQEFFNALQQDETLGALLQAKAELLVAVFRRYSRRSFAPSPRGTLHAQLLDYKAASQCARDYGLVPFLLNEQQLFRLFQELCTFQPADGGAFPPLEFPEGLSHSLRRAEEAAAHEDGVAEWTEQQQAVLGAQLQAMGFAPPAAKKKVEAAPAGPAEEMSLHAFVACLGAIAVQQEVVHLPTVLDKVEKLLELLESRHVDASRK